MGIFNKIFSFMGFEDNVENPQPKKEKKKKPLKIEASYKLNQKKKQTQESIKTLKLSKEDEILELVDLLKKDGAVIADLSQFEKTKKIRAFDFLSGAVFALDGQIKKMETNIYLCVIDELSYFVEE